MIVIMLLMAGMLLGLAAAYAGLVAYWRHAEVPGVHRMHDEGPRVLVGDGGLRAL